MLRALNAVSLMLAIMVNSSLCRNIQELLENLLIQQERKNDEIEKLREEVRKLEEKNRKLINKNRKLKKENRRLKKENRKLMEKVK